MVDEIPHEPRVKHIKREYFHPWVSPNVVVADLNHFVRLVLIENRLGLLLVFSASHYAIEFIHLLKKVVLEWRAEVIHRDVLKNISRFIEFVLGDQVSRTLNQELLSYHRHDGKRHAYRSNQSVPPILDIIVHIYNKDLAGPPSKLKDIVAEVSEPNSTYLSGVDESSDLVST